MPKTYNYENPERLRLIQDLRKLSRKEDALIWKRVAQELSRSRKNRREVNLGKLNKMTSKGEFILIPGKLLGGGYLDHSLDIAAFQFTKQAKEKVSKVGGKVISIRDMIKERKESLKKNLRGSKYNKIRLMG